MSGDSYNYLCYKEPGDLFSCVSIEDIEKISGRLSELGYREAALASFRALATIRKARDRVTAASEEMHVLWHAIEWLDSYDYSEETVDCIVKEWLQGDIAA